MFQVNTSMYHTSSGEQIERVGSDLRLYRLPIIWYGASDYNIANDSELVVSMQLEVLKIA